MVDRIRSKLSYANVMATVAVFIALGGVSYAATQLPKNSVGAKQLKKDAVTGAKVKDGSLKKADFAAGQLPSGATGPIGPAGPAGAPAPGGGKSVQMAVFKEGPSGANATQAFAPSGVSVANDPIVMVAPVAMEIANFHVLTPQQGIGQAVQVRIESSPLLGATGTPLVSCTVVAETNTCTNSQTATIAAGELLIGRITNGPGGAVGGFVSVGYTLKPS
jgi:hypothetical protein